MTAVSSRLVWTAEQRDRRRAEFEVLRAKHAALAAEYERTQMMLLHLVADAVILRRRFEDSNELDAGSGVELCDVPAAVPPGGRTSGLSAPGATRAAASRPAHSAARTAPSDPGPVRAASHRSAA